MKRLGLMVLLLTIASPTHATDTFASATYHNIVDGSGTTVHAAALRSYTQDLTGGAVDSSVCLVTSDDSILADNMCVDKDGNLTVTGACNCGSSPDPLVPADGTQNITGNLAVSGGTTLGDASTDAVLITAATTTLGTGAAGIDYCIDVNAETNDPATGFCWMEDENYWRLDNNLYVSGGTVTATNFAGNATTATSATSASYASSASSANTLAANGINCAASSFPLGVDAAGNVESCSTSISGNAATASALAADPTDCASSNSCAYAIAASGNLTCTSRLDFGDQNITNVGDISADSITADGTTLIFSGADITVHSSGPIALDADTSMTIDASGAMTITTGTNFAVNGLFAVNPGAVAFGINPNFWDETPSSAYVLCIKSADRSLGYCTNINVTTGACTCN